VGAVGQTPPDSQGVPVSSTSRGAERAQNDTYFTKYPVALACCEALKEEGRIVSPSRILEPSCGRGAFLRAACDVWPEASVDGVDIDTSLVLPEHVPTGKLFQEDFLRYEPAAPYDAVIGNPPYSQAEQHIMRALSLIPPGHNGIVAFLLRLNFLGGVDRQKTLLSAAPPNLVMVLDKRPSFQDDNGTDSCEYALFVWDATEPAGYKTELGFLQWRDRYFTQWEYTPLKRTRAKSLGERISRTFGSKRR